MMLESLIKEVVDYQRKGLDLYRESIPRNIVQMIDLDISHVHILSGVRRSGKSTIFVQLISTIENFYYLNFEDPRLAHFEVNDFFKLEKIFKSDGSSCVFFFDEIQNVKGWERYIRVLHDQKGKVVLTGSNARLMSTELGGSLTGRQLTYEVFPFSYGEFLSHEKFTEGRVSLLDYLKRGGFPEFLQMGKRDVLLGLFSDIVFRDIVVRNGVRNADIVRDLGLYLASNIGEEFSYNKLASRFELGSVNSILSYVSFFEDSYLFFPLSRYSNSLKKQSKNRKKIYCVDTGLVSNLTMSFSKKIERLLENMVFVELMRHQKKVFYFKEKYECDFVTTENGQPEMAIQVCSVLNDENMANETNGILEALKVLNLDKGYIVTLDQDDVFEVDGKTIEIVSAWKWRID